MSFCRFEIVFKGKDEDEDVDVDASEGFKIDFVVGVDIVVVDGGWLNEDPIINTELNRPLY